MLQRVIGNSGGSSASAQPPQQPAEAHGSVGVELEERGTIEGERSSGGNGWPRQETLALIKIRSDMDFAFRDASAKGPLWDEVSRKLGELGYHRSGKKCREKFENVYKYHKRTKEGRTSKSDGKTYRFFDQLEALEGNLNPRPPPPPAMTTHVTTTQLPFSKPLTPPSVAIPFNNITGSHHQNNNVSPISVAAPAAVTINPFSHPNMSASTSSTSSDEEPPEVRRKRKRKWKDFFGRLMKEVIHKQEELQMKFLEQIDKQERQRMAREEAWRTEEMAKLSREHDLLVQERSIAAAKDAAVITFLQKITEQNPIAVPPILQQQRQNQPQQPMQQQQIVQPQTPAPAVPPQQQVQQLPLPVVSSVQAKNVVDNNNGGVENSNMLAPSPSRWPKAEVNALIKLRTTLDMKYLDSGPKGPLWEEISAGMMKLGYNRNAKRCKEKWENINKYYKKVKESSKKRPEDSKTCPYFHQLDAIYRERVNNNNNNNNNSQNNPTMLPADTTQMEPIMAEPEQQWPLPAVVVQHQTTLIHRSHENIDGNNENEYDDDEDEDEEDEGGEYEIVPNNNSSSMTSVRVTET